jgi:hypothetical protein
MQGEFIPCELVRNVSFKVMRFPLYLASMMMNCKSSLIGMLVLLLQLFRMQFLFSMSLVSSITTYFSTTTYHAIYYGRVHTGTVSIVFM